MAENGKKKPQKKRYRKSASDVEQQARSELRMQRRYAKSQDLAGQRQKEGKGPMTRAERAAYDKTVRRSDKVLGEVPPVPKEGAVESLLNGIRMLIRKAKSVGSGFEEFEKIPGRMDQ